MYYMLVCPCIKTRNVHDEEKRRKSCYRYCFYFFELIGYLAAGIFVTAGIVWLAFVQLISCFYALEVPTQLISYAWSVVTVSSVMEIIVIATKFLGIFPIGIKICGFKILKP